MELDVMEFGVIVEKNSAACASVQRQTPQRSYQMTGTSLYFTVRA